MNHRPDDPEWEGRDRFYLSIGHYAIALYAALIEAGVLSRDEILAIMAATIPLCRCRAWPYTPGMGDHRRFARPGLTVAVGAYLALKRKRNRQPRLQPAVRRRTRRRFDLGTAMSAAHRLRQPHRHRRRQQPEPTGRR